MSIDILDIFGAGTAVGVLAPTLIPWLKRKLKKGDSA